MKMLLIAPLALGLCLPWVSAGNGNYGGNGDMGYGNAGSYSGYSGQPKTVSLVSEQLSLHILLEILTSVVEKSQAT